MPEAALPNVWNLYNLASSPFFQGTLEHASGALRPLSLFVGRGKELASLRSRIHGAGGGSSRQAVAGMPGVGKTTLAQELKSVMLHDGYLTTDDLVPILPDDTAEDLFGRILSSLYEIILANRPHAAGSPAMRDAQVVVRTSRLHTGGANISGLGFGVGASKGMTITAPKSVMIDGPRIMRDLLALVRTSDARGVLLHLNNLENLTDRQAKTAGDIVRSLRDFAFMHDGIHYLIVGTTDAVSAAINQHPQVRSVFDTLLLEPLAIGDVHHMLEERYNHLCLSADRPVTPPVSDETVVDLSGLYRGDLRGLLKALDDGVTQLIGLVGLDPSDDASSTMIARPLTTDELRPALQQRYAEELATVPEQTRVEQLMKWGRTAPDAAQTQRALMQLWKVSQGAVSMALAYLIDRGYVLALPRSGAQANQYVLSGTSRIIFG